MYIYNLNLCTYIAGHCKLKILKLHNPNYKNDSYVCVVYIIIFNG